VSFVAGSDGRQVGAAAQRMTGPAPQVLLSPGGAAVSTLAIVEAGNFGPVCQITSIRGLRVYPPNQLLSLYVPHPDQACANTRVTTLKVFPLVSG
jgi:hypothetical protein